MSKTTISAGVSLLFVALACAQETDSIEYKEVFNTDGSVTYETSKGSVTFSSEEVENFAACGTLDEEIAGHEDVISDADYTIAGTPQFVSEQYEFIERLRDRKNDYGCGNTSRLKDIGIDPEEIF